MLACMVYLLIWVAVPAYFDAGGIEITKVSLQSAETKLVDIDTKIANARSLVEGLNRDFDQQNVLFQYLPEKKQDEQIIASIDAMASREGVFASSFGVEDEKIVAAVNTDVASDGATVTEPIENSVKNFNVSLIVTGDYEKIKKFIVDLAGFKRFNEMVSLNIEKSSDANGSLKAAMVLKFNYLVKLDTISNFDDSVFAKGNFDMGLAEDIKSKANFDISKIEAGSLGRTNPFAL